MGVVKRLLKFDESYLLRLQHCFPVHQMMDRGVVLAYATGDAWSVENINAILGYRPWSEISDVDLCQCGHSELESYLRKEAFVYYIPAFLKWAMREVENPRTGLTEVLGRMVLPFQPGYEDVWDAWGDGIYDRPLSDWAFRSHERCQYLYECLDPQQKKCIAIFVESYLSQGQSCHWTSWAPADRRFVEFWSRSRD